MTIPDTPAGDALLSLIWALLGPDSPKKLAEHGATSSEITAARRRQSEALAAVDKETARLLIAQRRVARAARERTARGLEADLDLYLARVSDEEFERARERKSSP